MKKKSLLRRFAAYYRPHLKLFLLDLSCAFAVALINVVFPLLSNHALRNLLPEKLFSAFFLMIGICFAMYILQALMNYIVTYLGHDLGVAMEADMRRDIFAHIQQLPFSFYDKTRTGKLMSRVTTDLFEITELAHHGPEDLFLSVLTLIGSVTVMAGIEWRLALLLVAVLPFAIGFAMLQRRRMSAASHNVKARTADINAGIESSISGARVAKAFANEEYEVKKFVENNERFRRSKREYYRAMAIFTSGVEFFMGIMSVVVLAGGGYLIMRERMDVITLVTFNLYVASFLTPIRKLAAFMEVFTDGSAGFSRFCELMDVGSDITDMPDAVEVKNVKGDVAFSHVSFSYDDGAEVLRDINIKVDAGRTVALVGPSGAGKTTLCHLIPRFYEPDEGVITIDGRDIRSIKLHSLRSVIGIVQQDVFLFADTVLENIRYGRIDATDEEIVSAAIAAEIHDDIMAMPDGYHTVLGERGITLSGGQKQRVSIARLFLKNPPILILDEATSALDTVTEARIQRAFEKLSAGRTTLIIAHRLTTIQKADEILVVDHAGITERGTHESLMKLGGEYSKLYSITDC